MESNYIKALETRVKWASWARNHGIEEWGSIDKIKNQVQPKNSEKKSYLQALPSYINALEVGDTFFMNKRFSSLVEHARLTIPDDLVYENNWLQSNRGWMWIEEPFFVPCIEESTLSKLKTQEVDLTDKISLTEALDNLNPELKTSMGGIKTRVAAVGWFQVPEGTRTSSNRIAGPAATEFLCYQDFSLYASNAQGFGCWSYFMLQDGDKLIDRIRQFEDVATHEGGAYVRNRTTDMMHEIRWVYAAFYLMAQRLATSFHRDTDRNTKRRAEREKRPVPNFIRVISLRKFEEAKAKAEASGSTIDWQWQWTVRGHWRNQYLPSTGEHKQTYIEAYVKGPDDKPMKPEGCKVFLARR